MPTIKQPAPIKLPVDLVARIDAVKDPLIPRTAWVVDVVAKAVVAAEEAAKR